MTDRSGARLFWTVTLLAVVVATAVVAVTWRLSHNEPDEVIYWTLAHSLLERGSYTLQGTKLLELLPADMYDRPLFHHPPLFPLTLVPFAAADAWSAAILVPWLGRALCVLAVALCGRRVLAARGEPDVWLAPMFWVPLLVVAVDPLSLFLARKLWIDALLAGLVSLGLALVFTAPGARRERALFVAGGVCLGLAALSKLVALLALPVAALFLWRETRGPARRRALALVLAPALVLVLPWLVWFRIECGAFLPTWSRPSDEMLARDPFIRTACERGPLYYAVKTLLVQPVFALGLVLVLVRPARLREPAVFFSVLWFGVFLVALTAIGQTGNSPHFLRYLAPAFPAAAVLLFGVLAERGDRSALAVAAAALAVLAGLGAAEYLFTSEGNEILSAAEVLLGVHGPGSG